MIGAVLQEVEGYGCTVTAEGDKLRLHDVCPLTDRHKQQLRIHKVAILQLFKQQEAAKQKGWIVYPYGEGYEKQVSRNTFVYIFLEEDGTYSVWRGTWRDKNAPDTEKLIVERVNFSTALERANSYIQWFKK